MFRILFYQMKSSFISIISIDKNKIIVLYFLCYNRIEGNFMKKLTLGFSILFIFFTSFASLSCKSTSVLSFLNSKLPFFKEKTPVAIFLSDDQYELLYPEIHSYNKEKKSIEVIGNITILIKNNDMQNPCLIFDEHTFPRFMGLFYPEITYSFPTVQKESRVFDIVNVFNGLSAAHLDLKEKKMYFENYDKFFTPGGKPCDVGTFTVGENTKNYVNVTFAVIKNEQEISLDWSNREGFSTAIILNEGNCHLVLPLNFVNDVFLTPAGNGIVYNGKNVYFNAELQLSEELSKEFSQN